MGRGPFFFIIQGGIILAFTSVGVWAVVRPRHLQGFINENFALFPLVRAGSLSTFVTSNLLRLIGLGLIFFGCSLLANFKDEIVWLASLMGLLQLN